MNNEGVDRWQGSLQRVAAKQADNEQIVSIASLNCAQPYSVDDEARVIWSTTALRVDWMRGNRFAGMPTIVALS